MKNKLIIFAILLLFISFPALAAEYQIGELVIGENTTPSEYLSYIYQLFVGIGALIAVVMVFMAGIDWMTSEGNPSKIDSAKSKIINALLGVGILLGSSLIVGLINPEMNTFNIEEASCENGIVAEVREGYQRTKCIDSTTAEINYEILGTANEDSWNFPPGSLLSVYVYSEPNFKGEKTIFDFSETNTYSGDIAGAKSIYFVRKSPGIYLYDDIGYKLIKEQSPLLVLIDQAYFQSNFNNSISSIYIIDNSADKNADDYFKYSAVAFTEAGQKGRCALISENIEDLDNHPISKNYTDNIGANTISSMIFNKIIDPNIVKRGEVIFYSSTNCGRLGSVIDPTNQIKECRVDIKSDPFIGNIEDNCSDFEEGDNIMSFQINGTAGLVLSTSNISNGGVVVEGSSDTKCEYFSTQGYCVNLISSWNSSIYTIQGEKPKGFIILPTD